MRGLSAAAIARACGGRVVSGPGQRPIRGVSTDSRTVRPDELFVALRGQRLDGHAFVFQALQAGAAAVLVEQARAAEVPAGPWAVIAVPDTLAALQQLAAGYRRQLAARVVAVTGSVGKTTTKEMVAAILARRFRVARAPASYNNEVGVPLSVLAAEPESQVLVLELAMRGPGQIGQLAALAEPDVGIITNVGESHLELLGSREAIAHAKGELLEHLRPGGTAVLNGDDPRVMAQAGRAGSGRRVLTFGQGEAVDVRVEQLAGGGLGGTAFRLRTPWGEADCRLGLPGRHLALNAAAAAAAALVVGASLQDVAEGLAGFVGGPMRLQVVRRGDTVILHDAYNASPTSMRAALETLAEVRAQQRARAVAVLGDMRELGSVAAEAHREMGQLAARCGVELLVAVGSLAAELAQGALAGGLRAEQVVQVPDAEQAARVARERVQPGDVVLVKASRAVGLERVVEALVGPEGGR